MHQGRIVFSQLLDFLPKKSFRTCVNRYKGNYRIRSFTCYEQFLCMAFAQLTYRESLRDTLLCLRAMHTANVVGYPIGTLLYRQDAQGADINHTKHSMHRRGEKGWLDKYVMI